MKSYPMGSRKNLGASTLQGNGSAGSLRAERSMVDRQRVSPQFVRLRWNVNMKLRRRHIRCLAMPGRAALALILLASPSACASHVHRAKKLDVSLDVRVMDLRREPQKVQPETDHRLTYLDVKVDILNPSNQRLWANDCHGQARDAGGHLVYVFSFQPGPPAGQFMAGHGRFAGWVMGTARVSYETVGGAATATATCEAWDWGDNPPI
jgi:hypothetical protein